MTLIKSISGIRGTIGGKENEGLTPIDIVKYVSAFASLISSNENTKIVTGRDGRISGEAVHQIVNATLYFMGIDVIDLGLSTTPSVEMAVKEHSAAGGLILTASHNPQEWNALKMLNADGEFISAELGQQILECANQGEFDYASIQKVGTITKNDDAIASHIEHILNHPLVNTKAIAKAGFSIVVDGINSTGAVAVPQLLVALGVNSDNIQVLNSNIDGKFAHNPEPLPENLTEISNVLEHGNYQLGIVVDPDVDRLCFINEDGSMFGEEYTLVAIADYVLSKTDGTKNTVSNLSSTKALKDVTEKHGGTYFASAVGEVNVVEMMKKHHAVIGGEGNGGIIDPTLHYGRDALIGIALFLSQLAESGKSAKQLRSQYPDYFISKNKIALSEGVKLPEIMELIEKKYVKEIINKIDGLKIYFDTGDWIHLRASNTEPIIRIYAESTSQNTAENLSRKIMKDISETMKEM